MSDGHVNYNDWMDNLERLASQVPSCYVDPGQFQAFAFPRRPEATQLEAPWCIRVTRYVEGRLVRLELVHRHAGTEPCEVRSCNVYHLPARVLELVRVAETLDQQEAAGG